MEAPQSFLEGAAAETALPGTAWWLLEAEILEYLADGLAKAHPKLCGQAKDEKPLSAAFVEVERRATALLARQAEQVSGQRTTLVNVARLALNVSRAVAKFKQAGSTNLKAQLTAARAARAAEHSWG